jgi:hypothetical protein
MELKLGLKEIENSNNGVITNTVIPPHASEIERKLHSLLDQASVFTVDIKVKLE